jgi:hypothetical protein
MTTDGNSKDLKFARLYVGEDDAFHCACHIAQLCLGDALDSDKATPPTELEEHHELVDRLWELMTTLRNHMTIREAFSKIVDASQNDTTKYAASAITKSQTREWNSLSRLISKMLLIVRYLEELYKTTAFSSHERHQRLTIDNISLERMNILQFPLVEVKRFTEWAEQRDKLLFPYYPKRVDELVTVLESDELFGNVVASPQTIEFGKVFARSVAGSVRTRYALFGRFMATPGQF